MSKSINKYVFLLVGAFLLGGLGADRFMRGQILLGILKLITMGGFGIWYLIDLIICLVKLGKYGEEFSFSSDGKWTK